MNATMKTISRIALVLLAVAAIGFGVLHQQLSRLWAAPSPQTDLSTLAELTRENSAEMVEAMRLAAPGVTDAHFFPDGQRMALAMPEGVVIYDVATWSAQRTIPTGASRRIALSADGEMVATMAGNEAQLWRVSDGELLHTLSGHGNTIEDVAFSPLASNPEILATASLDRTVRLWRASSGQLIYQLNHLGHVYSLAFRFDGAMLATGSDAGTTLWNPYTGRRFRVADVAFDVVNRTAFSPDGLSLALALNWGHVRIRSGNNYNDSVETARNQSVTALAYSPNGQLLAYGDSGERIYVGDASGAASFVTLAGHQGAINSLTFSPDGRLLVSTAADGTLRVWGSEASALPTATSTATSVPTATRTAPAATPTAPATATSSPTTTVAPTATSAARVTVVVNAPAAPTVTSSVTSSVTSTVTSTTTLPVTPASGAAGSASGLPRGGQTDARQEEDTGQADEISALPLVIIEPEEVVVEPTDWQQVMSITGPGANVSLCQEDRLWLSSDQQVWSFDGEAWQRELANQAATVACDPDGVPYALVTSPSAEAGRLVATLYRQVEGSWKEVGITTFFAGDGLVWFDWAVDRDGTIWAPILLADDPKVVDGEELAGETIAGVVHYDEGIWHLYVGEDETRLDDPESKLGALVSAMTLHKSIPAEYAGPSPLLLEALGAPISTYPEIDILEDGTIWLKGPVLWPIFFDGDRWQPGVDADLAEQLYMTLLTEGASSAEGPDNPIGLINALAMNPLFVTYGVLNAQDVPEGAPQDAAWIGVAGGVLHQEDGQWTLYSLPNSPDYPATIIPLAEGPDGTAWFWNVTGILRFDGEEWRRFTLDADFASLFDPLQNWPAATLDATVGPDGALWMGGTRLLPGGEPIGIPTGTTDN